MTGDPLGSPMTTGAPQLPVAVLGRLEPPGGLLTRQEAHEAKSTRSIGGWIYPVKSQIRPKGA